VLLQLCFCLRAEDKPRFALQVQPAEEGAGGGGGGGGPAFTPSEAWAAFRLFKGLPEVTFLDQPHQFVHDLSSFTNRHDFPKSLWTNACLASWAIGNSAHLVSFDADFHQFPGLDFFHLT
jgi:hypothetical protein